MFDNFEIIFFALTALGVVVAVVLGARHQRERWETAGEQLGLDWKRGGIFGSSGLSGRYRGMDVEIYAVDRGGKNTNKPYTVYKVTPPIALPPGLALTEENMLASVGKFFGFQDVQVGRDLLDDTFVIKSSRPDAAREFLRRPGVEGALLELYNRHPNMHLKDGCLCVENKGNDVSFQMEQTLDHLVEALDKMAPADKPHAPGVGPASVGPASAEPIEAQPAPPDPAAGEGFGRPEHGATERPDTSATASPTAPETTDGHW